jgi:hypothetical protein
MNHGLPHAHLAAPGWELSWNLPKWKLSPAHHAAQMSAKVALTRRNIMIRDRFCCQYCGSKRNLTLDHVHPQSKGGRNTWCNLVTACMVCNQKKGSRWGGWGEALPAAQCCSEPVFVWPVWLVSMQCCANKQPQSCRRS